MNQNADGSNYFDTNYEIAGNCLSQMPDIDIRSLDGKQSLSSYQEKYDFISNNTDATPQFMNEGEGDFSLEGLLMGGDTESVSLPLYEQLLAVPGLSDRLRQRISEHSSEPNFPE